jgi:hypothetical protein
VGNVEVFVKSFAPALQKLESAEYATATKEASCTMGPVSFGSPLEARKRHEHCGAGIDFKHFREALKIN